MTKAKSSSARLYSYSKEKQMFKKIDAYLRNVVKTELDKFEAAAVADAKLIENDFKAVVADVSTDIKTVVADARKDIADLRAEIASLSKKI
jgi:hypothetical protein